MNLREYFTEEEIDMIINAVVAKHNHWRAVANRNNHTGTARELERQEEAEFKAKAWRDLESKIAEAAN